VTRDNDRDKMWAWVLLGRKGGACCFLGEGEGTTIYGLPWELNFHLLLFMLFLC